MSTIDERWNIVNTTRAFCQKVLPLVYDESLSYMELVCKLSSKLNEVIENNNNLPQYVKDLIKETVNSDEFTQIVGSVMMDTIINVKYPPEGITPSKGDGVTDDTASIQACLDYANSQGGAVVFFPSGKYLTGTLNINTETSILGADRYNTSLVLKGGGSTPLLQGVINQSVRNICLDGNRLNQIEENYLIDGNIDMALFDNVILCDSAHCITADACNNSEFCNVLCKDIGDGAFITAAGNNNMLTNINTDYSIVLTGNNNNIISKNNYAINSVTPLQYQTPQNLNYYFNYITMQDANGNAYKVLVDENAEYLSTDEFVNVKNAEIYGLDSVVGDGQTDDSAKFQAILNYCSQNNKACLIPYGTTLYLNSSVSANNLYYLEFRGNIKLNNVTLKLGANSQNRNPAKYNIFSVDGGTLELNGLKNAIVTINDATKLVLKADGQFTNTASLAYSTFILGDINEFEITNANNGWVNENTFIKGRFGSIMMGGTYLNNHNVFYNPVIENCNFTITAGRFNYFLNCRLEGINNFTFGPNSNDNKVVKTWYSSGLNGLANIVPSTTGGSIVDEGNNNQIITDARENARVEIMCNINYLTAKDYYPEATIEGKVVTMPQYTTIPINLYAAHNKGVVLQFASDAANWRVHVKPLDENGNTYADNPNITNNLTWNNGEYAAYVNRNSHTVQLNFQNTNIPYYEVSIENYAGLPFKSLEFVKIEYKDDLV